MEEAVTDDSSDELYSSYKTSAKRAYLEAKKRASEAKIITTSEDIFDISSDSDDCQPIKKAKLTRKERSKSARPTRTKKKKLAVDETTPVTKKPEVICEILSSDDDSLNNVVKAYKSSMSHKVCDTARDVRGIEDDDYDTEPEVERPTKNKEVVTLSDTSDVEIVSTPEVIKSKIEDSNELMSIKISWRFQPIQKFQLRRHQKFKTLLEHFAQLEGVPIEQVLIHGGKDKWRSIEAYDTPDSIGITIADVLEGGILSNGSAKHSSQSKRYRDPLEVDGEEIELRVQQEQTRSFPVLIKKHQKMKVLFIKVAEQLEIDLAKVKLFIDGEVIAPNSTPKDLDLDNGDVLDMMMV